MRTTLLHWGAALLRATLALVGVLIIVLAVLTLGARLGLPFVAGYKSDIQHALSDYLGRPVAIDTLSLAWRATGPVLDAGGLVVGDPDADRVAIDAALLDLDVFASAWRRRLVFNELTLVGADLQLSRAADGRLALRGLGRGTAPGDAADARRGGGTRALAWLFDARRVGLVDARLDLVDEARQRRFAFEALTLSVENGDGQHRVRLAVDLPEALGGRIEIGADLADGLAAVGLDGSGLDALVGDVHLRSERLDLGAVAGMARVLGSRRLDDARLAMLLDEVPGAMLATELWGRLDGGRVTALQGRIEADRLVAARGRDAVPPDTLLLPFTAERSADGWRWSASGVEVAQADATWALPPLTGTFEASDAAARPGWRIRADGSAAPVPLSLVHAASSLVPARVAPSVFAWLDAATPTGRLAGWQIDVQAGIGGGAPRTTLAADLSALTLRPVGPVPGATGLDLSARWDDAGGTVELAGDGSGETTLSVPPLRRDPWRLSSLAGALRIERQAAGWRIAGPLSARAGSLSADARASATFDGGASPLLDVRGEFSLDDAEDLAGLLPDRAVGRETMDWFDGAFTAGRAHHGELLWRGRVTDFPYDDGDGVFRATAQVDGLALNWAPGWPAARDVAGQLTFDGAAIDARVAGGRIDAMTISGARIGIADLRASHLTLSASGDGPVPAMLDWATSGALSEYLAPALGDASGNGRAGLDLAVAVPLSARAFQRFGPLSVDGSLFLKGNRLAFERADIVLDDVIGGISFDEAGARMHRVRARWLDRPVRLDASTDGQGAARQMTLTLKGVLDAPDVLAHYELPLDLFVRGASAWNASLTVPFDAQRLRREGVVLAATSDLVGTELQLPEPLRKSAAQAARFTLATAFRDGEPTVRWRIEHDGTGTPIEALADVADSRLLSLAIGAGSRSANPAGRPGVRIDAEVEALDADGWIESLATLIEALEETSSTGSDDTPDDAILPISGVLSAERLSLRRAPLGRARMQLNSDDDYLNVVLDNAHVAGNLRYPRRERTRDGSLWPLTARLSRVEPRTVDALLGKFTPDDAADETDPLAPGGPDPRALPPIQARIATLAWNRVRVDGVTLRTEPTRAGLAITAIGFTHDELQVYGDGAWQLADPQGFDARRDGEHRTELALTAQSGSFESGLRDIGLDGLLGATAGRVNATLRWPGPLWLPDVATLDGRLDMSLRRGRIVPLEPGAGKLIGLFALQALPRRLSLDFSDVMQDGLAFNSLDGDAELRDGVLDTALLQLTGPVGVIDVTGTTDLVQQTLDQRVTVLPRVSAALPIIGAISGGASAGVGVLIAGGLLKALGVDFDRIGLREYALTGPWDEPKLGPLPRPTVDR